MRTLLITTLSLCLATPLAAKKQAKREKDPKYRLPQAEMTKPGDDLSAHRIDSDVWGWAKDFGKMGVVGSDVKRTKEGAHRGWTFVMVFPLGSIEPEFKIISTRVTQAALPHNPEPLYDIRDRLWSVEYNFQRTYPRRCKLKQPRGAMKIAPIWEFVEDDGACTPAIGFLLTWKGETRYQPHLRMKLAADCELMRYSDHRTYWGKKDIGAVMIRFDWGPPKNESSARFPLAASWKLSRRLNITVRGSNPTSVRDAVSQYGKVEVVAGQSGAGWVVQYGHDDLIYMAHRIAAQVNGSVSKKAPPDGTDILIMRGAAATIEDPVPAWQLDDSTPSDFEPDHQCGGLLRDCDK